MFLSQINKNEKAIIISIDSDDELINRLASFGITEDSLVEVIQFSLAKNTMEIECDGTAVALRIKEAQLIKVERV